MSFSTSFAENHSHTDVDLATQSNYHDIRTTHLDLIWNIDWSNQLIGGSITLVLEATKDVHRVILDTSYLDIKTVEVGGEQVNWELGEKVAEIVGRGLTVQLPGIVKKGEMVKITVTYSTTKECTAVGWLTPVYVIVPSSVSAD